MFLHAWYIERFVQENAAKLKGACLIDCFSLSKSELFFVWQSAGGQCINWRLHWDAQQFFISFPSEVHRKSKVRLNQFFELHNLTVQELAFVENERCFYCRFEQGFDLVFKLHGRNANVILFQNQTWKSMFRLNQLSDAKAIWTALTQSGHSDSEIPKAQWIESPILLVPRQQVYDLTPASDRPPISSFSTMEDAWNHLTPLYLKAYHFKHLQSQLIQARRAALKQLKKRLKGSIEKLEKLERQKAYRSYGDLIFSHLSSIKKGMTEASLLDYASNSEVQVPLLKDLTPEQNAERYYRKAKNQHLEHSHLQAKHAVLEKEAQAIEKEIRQLEHASGFSELKAFAPKQKAVQAENQQKRLPYHEYMHMGFIILVGKTSKDNDELSLRIARKNDLWLHARDVPGSHVIIKEQSGKNFPEPVIEYAAELAAAFSKLGNDSLCPVIYTPRKFIRKRKGGAPGEVIVDKESVVLVEPNRHQAKGQ